VKKLTTSKTQAIQLETTQLHPTRSINKTSITHRISLTNKKERKNSKKSSNLNKKQKPFFPTEIRQNIKIPTANQKIRKSTVNHFLNLNPNEQKAYKSVFR
jgi:ATP adenylyltransferase/5',5'''-P-1,P-4-tetraphosphate phosphorylase II